MAKNEFPLSLVIKAVDQATAPLRAVNKRIQEATAPVRKLNNAFKALSVEAGVPRIANAMRGVGSSLSGVVEATRHVGQRFMELQAVGGFALFELAKSTMEAGSRLGRMSERVGLGVDAYAQLEYSAKQADVEQEGFASAMDKLNKNLGEMRANGGPLLEFLNKVSPALALQMRGAKGMEGALALLAGAFDQVPDPAKKAALATAAFGRDGVQMGQWLSEGIGKITEQRAEFFRFAGSQKNLKKVGEEAERVWKQLSVAFMGVRNAVGGELLPVMTQLSGTLRDLLAGHREEIAAWAKKTGKAVTDWVQGGGLQRLTSRLEVLGTVAGGIVDRLGGGGNTLAAVAAAWTAAPLVPAILAVTRALWALGAAAVPVALRGIMLLTPAVTGLAGAFASATVAAAPFLIAAGAIAAASYQIWKHFDDLKTLFTEFSSPGGSLGTFLEMLKAPQELLVGSVLKTAWQGWSRDLGFGGLRPTIGAAAAAGAGAPRALGPSQAHVTVDFANLPRGARVRADPTSTADLDLSLGYSMMTP